MQLRNYESSRDAGKEARAVGTVPGNFAQVARAHEVSNQKTTVNRKHSRKLVHAFPSCLGTGHTLSASTPERLAQQRSDNLKSRSLLKRSSPAERSFDKLVDAVLRDRHTACMSSASTIESRLQIISIAESLLMLEKSFLGDSLTPFPGDLHGSRPLLNEELRRLHTGEQPSRLPNGSCSSPSRVHNSQNSDRKVEKLTRNFKDPEITEIIETYQDVKRKASSKAPQLLSAGSKTHTRYPYSLQDSA